MNAEYIEENKKKWSVYDITGIGIMAAIIAVLAPFSIPLPFSPVPISFTNLAVYLTAFLLGYKKGTISYLIYLLVGLAGLPVFSGFTAGFGKLAGPTGGYLIGFIFMMIISGYFMERFQRKMIGNILGMVLGTIITYILGTLWLGHQLHMDFTHALSIGVIPYIIGDGVKIVVIAVVGPTIRKSLVRARVLL